MKFLLRERKYQGLIALTAALLLVAPAMAQVRIGVVDMSQLLEQSPQAQQVIESLQEEFAPRQRDLVQRQEDLAERQQRLERDAAVMSDQERRNLQRSVRDGQRDLERRRDEFVEDLNLRRNEVLGELQRQLLREIQTYARDLNYDLIVGDGVLYASSTVNITSEVLQKLQSDF